MRALLILIVLAGVSADAYAQAPGSTGEARAGVFTIHPGLVFSAGHDTNPYREANAESDIETYIIPQATGAFSPGRLRTNFFGAVEIVQFANRAGARNHQYGVHNEWQGARLMPFFDWTSKHTNANPTGFEVGRKSMRGENVLRAGVRTRLGGRVSALGYMNRTRTNWDADAVYQTSSLREKLNRTDTSYGGGLEVQLTPLTSVRFTGDRTTSDFMFSPQRNGTGDRFGPGLTISGPAAITGSVDVGFRSFTSTASGVNFRGLFSNIVLTRAFPTETIVTGRFDRDMQFSYDLSLAYFVSRSVQLAVIQPLNSSLAIQGFMARHSLLYSAAAPGIEPVNYVTEAGFAVGQRIGRVIRVGMQTEWAQASGNQPWSELRVVAFLTYGIGGFQRLDRPIPFDR
jgi:hypothetical protein